jgi:hypothetical protein
MTAPAPDAAKVATRSSGLLTEAEYAMSPDRHLAAYWRWQTGRFGSRSMALYDWDRRNMLARVRNMIWC